MHTATFGLIGYPLSHSFSKPYFTRFFAEHGYGKTHRYLNFPMEDIAGFVTLKDKYPDLRGCNVTIPHKRNVIRYLDRLDDSAARIGAVNCIRYEADGSTTGFNTDFLGFKTDLLANMLAHEEKRSPLISEHDRQDVRERIKGALALVLGTGGASLAVREALLSLGAQPMWVSRRAGDDRLQYEDVTAAVLQDYTIIVNTTPLGMAPNVDTYPDLPYAAIDGRHFAYDLVYNPEESAFLAKCRARGAGTANGLGMLHGQAKAGWKIWSAE